MFDAELFFCGLSKNNIESLKKNLEFIILYKQKSQFKNIKLLIVDSNSNDGSKEFLNEISQLNDFINIFHKDDLNSINSRVERIKICRNICLKYIDQNSKQKPLIYIPCDMDFYLFSHTSYNQIDLLVMKVIEEKNNNAVFPVSTPFYYDIFALRASGWLTLNSQLIVSRLKKFFKVGSFIFNYFFIFRFQLSPAEIKKKQFILKSAFGGIGIYNVSNLNLKYQSYQVNKKYKDWYSEHLYFNSYFDKLEIDADWIVQAPKEHVEFKTSSTHVKIIYFLKTIKEDLKKLFSNFRSF